MSFILDALKRAERERAQGQPQSSSLPLAPPAVTPAPQRNLRALFLLLLALCALLGAAIATIVWLLQQSRAPAAPSRAPVAVAAPPAVAEPEGATAAALPEPAPPPATAVEPERSAMRTLDDLGDDEPAPTPDADAASLDDAPATTAGMAAETPPPSSRRADSTRGSSRRPAREGRAVTTLAPAYPAEPAAPPAPARATRGPDIEWPMAAGASDRAATEAAPAEAASAPPPPAADNSLRQMPEAYRAQFPQLSVGIHVYNEDPRRRFVMIGGRRYVEGQTLAEGPHLLQIVPEGMVLEYQGQRLLYGLNH